MIHATVQSEALGRVTSVTYERAIFLQGLLRNSFKLFLRVFVVFHVLLYRYLYAERVILTIFVRRQILMKFGKCDLRLGLGSCCQSSG